MKMKIFAGLLGIGIAIIAAGCADTVAGTKTPKMWFGSDSFSAKYERPLDQVYRAAVIVMNRNGVVLTEYTFPQDNSANPARALYGKVNQRKVWIRVDQVDPKTSQVSVQALSTGGFSDQDLTHELEKEIGMQLVSSQ